MCCALQDTEYHHPQNKTRRESSGVPLAGACLWSWAGLSNAAEPASPIHSWPGSRLPILLDERSWRKGIQNVACILLLLRSCFSGQKRGDLSSQRQKGAKWVISGPNEVHEGPFLGLRVRWGYAVPRVSFAWGSRQHWSKAELILPTGADCAEGQGLWHWPYHPVMPRELPRYSPILSGLFFSPSLIYFSIRCAYQQAGCWRAKSFRFCGRQAMELDLEPVSAPCLLGSWPWASYINSPSLSFLIIK